MNEYLRTSALSKTPTETIFITKRLPAEEESPCLKSISGKSSQSLVLN